MVDYVYLESSFGGVDSRQYVKLSKLKGKMSLKRSKGIMGIY